MNKELESKLKSIEYHLDVVRSGDHHSARVFHYAQADIANIDVPYLLDLVRSQAAEIEAKDKALNVIANVVNRWENGELVGTERGTVWREPASALPTGIEEIKTSLKEGLGSE